MTKIELMQMLLTYDKLELMGRERFIQQTSPDDIESQVKYISNADANRYNFGNPELYYIPWDNESDVVSLNTFYKIDSTNKHHPTFRAEKKGVKSWIHIRKHGRFLPCYDHSHTFIEMNYVYSGRCVNVVEDREIVMNCGDVLIMKPGTTHRIKWAGEDDIILNIVMFPHATVTILNNTLCGNNDISAFFIDALYSKTSVPNFIHIKLSVFPNIKSLIDSMICEYFDYEQVAADMIVGSYLRVLFGHILRESVKNPEIVEFMIKPDSKVAEITEYIRTNCVACSRDSTAQEFGYSGSRISNILKEGTGKSFLQLRNEFRMELAEQYLESTSLSVTAVASECGFTNMRQFYRVYKEYFGRLPREHE